MDIFSHVTPGCMLDLANEYFQTRLTCLIIATVYVNTNLPKEVILNHFTRIKSKYMNYEFKASRKMQTFK